jgi:hypothetical protein
MYFMDTYLEHTFFVELTRYTWQAIGSGGNDAICKTHREHRHELSKRQPFEAPTLTELQQHWSRDVVAKSVACAVVQAWQAQRGHEPFPVRVRTLKNWTMLLIQQYTFARLYDFFLAFNEDNDFPTRLTYASFRGMFVHFLETQSAWLERHHRRQTDRTQVEQARVSDRLNQYFPKEMAALQAHFKINLFSDFKNAG